MLILLLLIFLFPCLYGMDTVTLSNGKKDVSIHLPLSLIEQYDTYKNYPGNDKSPTKWIEMYQPDLPSKSGNDTEYIKTLFEASKELYCCHVLKEQSIYKSLFKQLDDKAQKKESANNEKDEQFDKQAFLLQLVRKLKKHKDFDIYGANGLSEQKKNIENVVKKLSLPVSANATEVFKFSSDECWYGWRQALEDDVADYCKTLASNVPVFLLLDLDKLGFGERAMLQPLAHYLYDNDIYSAWKYPNEFQLSDVAQKITALTLESETKNLVVDLIETNVYSVIDAINDRGIYYRPKSMHDNLRTNRITKETMADPIQKEWYITLYINNSCIRSLNGLKELVKEKFAPQSPKYRFTLWINDTHLRVLKVSDGEEIFKLIADTPSWGMQKKPYKRFFIMNNPLQLLVGAPTEEINWWHLEGAFNTLKASKFFEGFNSSSDLRVVDESNSLQETIEAVNHKRRYNEENRAWYRAIVAGSLVLSQIIGLKYLLWAPCLLYKIISIGMMLDSMIGCFKFWGNAERMIATSYVGNDIVEKYLKRVLDIKYSVNREDIFYYSR